MAKDKGPSKLDQIRAMRERNVTHHVTPRSVPAPVVARIAPAPPTTQHCPVGTCECCDRWRAGDAARAKAYRQRKVKP